MRDFRLKCRAAAGAPEAPAPMGATFLPDRVRPSALPCRAAASLMPPLPSLILAVASAPLIHAHPGHHSHTTPLPRRSKSEHAQTDNSRDAVRIFDQPLLFCASAGTGCCRQTESADCLHTTGSPPESTISTVTSQSSQSCISGLVPTFS